MNGMAETLLWCQNRSRATDKDGDSREERGARPSPRCSPPGLHKVLKDLGHIQPNRFRGWFRCLILGRLHSWKSRLELTHNGSPWQTHQHSLVKNGLPISTVCPGSPSKLVWIDCERSFSKSSGGNLVTKSRPGSSNCLQNLITTPAAAAAMAPQSGFLFIHNR